VVVVRRAGAVEPDWAPSRPGASSGAYRRARRRTPIGGRPGRGPSVRRRLGHVSDESLRRCRRQ